MDDYDTDVLLWMHTGIQWTRALPDGRVFANAGAIGRPPFGGCTEVWYALLRAEPDFTLELLPVTYDHERLAKEMREEGLPEEFVETILTGWWTTCLEILPARERAKGKY
jgi:hypothetical protein